MANTTNKINVQTIDPSKPKLPPLIIFLFSNIISKKDGFSSPLMKKPKKDCVLFQKI